jgi:SnoaL-like domain
VAEDPRFAQILDRTITPELYQEILSSWLRHVTNEEKLFVPHTDAEAESAMREMLAVFTDDCAMELAFAGERWSGHDGARKFYAVFLSSFENMAWVPQALVIGPQGVLDVVNMTGRLVKPFAGFSGVGGAVSLQWTIYFPWDTARHMFRGEIIFSIRSLASGESVSIPFARG